VSESAPTTGVYYGASTASVVRRRDLLSATLALAAGAGCLGSEGIGVTDRALTVVDRRCRADPSGNAEITATESGIVVSGVFVSDSGCDGVRVDTFTTDGGGSVARNSVVVKLTAIPTDRSYSAPANRGASLPPGREHCDPCRTAHSYEATVDLTRRPTDVQVFHFHPRAGDSEQVAARRFS
jgi:hypothetical protein